jgi:hypothetical protein
VWVCQWSTPLCTHHAHAYPFWFKADKDNYWTIIGGRFLMNFSNQCLGSIYSAQGLSLWPSSKGGKLKGISCMYVGSEVQTGSICISTLGPTSPRSSGPVMFLPIPSWQTQPLLNSVFKPQPLLDQVSLGMILPAYQLSLVQTTHLWSLASSSFLQTSSEEGISLCKHLYL